MPWSLLALGLFSVVQGILVTDNRSPCFLRYCCSLASFLGIGRNRGWRTGLRSDTSILQERAGHYILISSDSVYEVCELPPGNEAVAEHHAVRPASAEERKVRGIAAWESGPELLTTLGHTTHTSELLLALSSATHTTENFLKHHSHEFERCKTPFALPKMPSNATLEI